MNEEIFFIALDPPLPAAGQIPTCWGPVKESDLAEFVEGFHLQGDYIIYNAGRVKKFTVKKDEKTVIEEI